MRSPMLALTDLALTKPYALALCVCPTCNRWPQCQPTQACSARARPHQSTPQAATSTGRCGANATPSSATRARAPHGPLRTAATSAAASSTAPRMLDTCTAATRRVLPTRHCLEPSCQAHQDLRLLLRGTLRIWRQHRGRGRVPMGELQRQGRVTCREANVGTRAWASSV